MESSNTTNSGDSCHVSVMADEVVQWLAPCHPRVIVDGTFGGGGHSLALLKILPPSGGRLLALDRDPAVFSRVSQESWDDRLVLFLGSYEQVPKAMQAAEVDHIDAMVLDLGLSSDQLADRSRGFSFTHDDAPLDLRFDPESGHPASHWLTVHSEKEIADAIFSFGEERYSRRIARAIVARRRQGRPVSTAGELAEICLRCVPRSSRHDIHPATRTFQALRIAVNDELATLQRTLTAAPEWFAPGGRIAVISFHSLEDRIVKQAFRDDPRWEPITKKPIRPSDLEIQQNPRSRSAKLRVAQRVVET